VRKKAIAGFSGGMRQRFGIAQALIGNPTLIIVDEPTAGLDPEERNRFNNLLAEIGESKVVILSHAHRRRRHRPVLAHGHPRRRPRRERGHAGRADRRPRRQGLDARGRAGELPALRNQFELIATRLRGGRTVIHILADTAPDPRFEPVAAGLAEVYFSTLHASARRARRDERGGRDRRAA
jgi:hypothetical protein